jgi:hypothetical protein
VTKVAAHAHDAKFEKSRYLRLVWSGIPSVVKPWPERIHIGFVTQLPGPEVSFMRRAIE